MALLWRLVVLKEGIVLLGLHDALPVDLLRVAEVVVLQDGHAAGSDLTERLEVQRLEGCLDDVEGGEVFSERPPADDLEITESGEIAELGMVSLDVDVASDFLDGGE